MIYILLGGPATGKGTRSNMLSKELKIPHISTGDLLRKEAKNNEKLTYLMSQGGLISDDVVNDLLEKRINQDDCKKGFILDGYPRAITQAYAINEMLEKLNLEITKVLELKVPRKLAFRRILERKQCKNCKKTYGIDFPSKAGDKCEVCGGDLEVRSDDNEETLTKRIDTFEDYTLPVINYYKEKGLLKTVDASKMPKRVEDIL